MPSKLEIELSNAKTKKEIENLLTICDKLHEGLEVGNYTIDDIPSDEIYEQYSLKINHENKFSDNSDGVIMFMGSVYKPKPNEDIEISNVILSPKYDGASVAIRLIKKDNYFIISEAHTKGRDVGANHSNQDVLEKFKYFIPKITIQPKHEKTFLNVNSIDIRGEFICKEKHYDEEGRPTASHSGIAAGQLNRLFNEFKNGIENFDYVAYEIAKIYTKKDEIIPDQKTAFKILKMLIINYVYDFKDKLYSGDTWIAESSVDINYPETYEMILKSEKHPTDGIVYCSETWKYPTEKSKFKSKFYGKYAWKPQSAKHTTITDLDYSMGKDGEINFCIHYEITMLNGKNFTQAKVAASKLQSLIGEGLGVGAICNLELKNDSIPYISTVITGTDTVFEFPKICPFCSKPVNFVYDNNDILKHVYCENPNCDTLLITKWSKFIGNMNKIYKQENGRILTTLNDKGKEVKSAISEGKLKKLSEKQKLTKDLIESYMPTLFEEFEKMELAAQLFVLGFGGEKSIQKLIEKNNYNTLEDVPNVWIYEV